ERESSDRDVRARWFEAMEAEPIAGRARGPDAHNVGANLEEASPEPFDESPDAGIADEPGVKRHAHLMCFRDARVRNAALRRSSPQALERLGGELRFRAAAGAQRQPLS